MSARAASGATAPAAREAGANRDVGPRLGVGERAAASSALVLLAASFFEWYGSAPAGQAHFHTDAGGSAWQTLEVVPVLLALTVAVALLAVALRLARSSRRPPVPLSAATAVLGGLSALAILLRIVFPPDLGSVGGIPLDATLSVGAFLALLAACGVAYGGYRAMGEEGDSFQSIADALQTNHATARISGERARTQGGRRRERT